MKHATSITTGRFATARGFTIIELMVTLAVAGMLTAMAVPAFNNFVLNDRDIGQINSLVASFNYARSEAIKLNSGGVQVCTSIDGQNCNGGTNWNGGWIVQETLPNAPSATVLQYVPAFAGTNTVKVGGATPNEVTFSSTGLVDAWLTIQICDSRGGAYSRDVEVNATGRVAASQTPGKSVAGAVLELPVTPMRTPVTSMLAPSSHRGLGGRRPAAAGRTAGFTIVEVLVSLVILSIGLLGIAKLVLYSAHSNDSAYLRSQATQLAYEILDNMRANPTAAAVGNYNTTLTTAAVNPGYSCLNAACPVAANLAAYDIYTWKKRLAAPTGALPSGQGSVTVSTTAPLMATIVVQWNDSAAQSIFGGTAVGVAAPMSVTLETALHP